MSDQAIILFSGNNQRALIAFCRFAQKNHIPFFIISSGPNDTIYNTDYSNRVVLERQERSLEFDHILDILKKIQINQGFKKLVILPSTEFLNRFLVRFKKDFKKNNIQIPLVKERVYELVSDKYSFSEKCQKRGLKIPEEYHGKKYRFPFVIKPKRYFSKEEEVQFKPIIIHNEEELKTSKEHHDLSEAYFQQYVDGPSYYLLYYISSKNDHVVYSQKNIVQQSGGGSIVAAKSANLHTEGIAEDYLELFLDIGFQGLVMVEVKYFDGDYYMIEANPRLWGPSQLFVDAHVPIFGQFAKEMGFQVDQIEKADEEVKYFWFGGIVDEYRSQNELKFYNYDENELFQNLPNWLSNEVYRRSDTVEIFSNELKKRKNYE